MKKTIATPNLLLDLPNELIGIIFKHLPFINKLSLKNTNRLLHKIFHENFICTIKPPSESITDEELATALTNCDHITSLDLYDCENITDAGLAAIAQHCPHITSLDLSYCKNITDAGLAAIAQHCSNLTNLDLSGTNITDEGLKAILEKYTKLTSLDLSYCENITDAGLSALPKHFPKLTSLDLTHTNITDEGLATLKDDLQNCRIIL